jgi:hypothetical protein
MSLFTDGAIADIEDLRGYDTQLLNVATVEGIDVTRKLSLAQEEIGVEVTGLLGRLTMAGQFNAPPEIGQVVVWQPLKLWHIFRSLEMVYGDAYNNQLNDRYSGRRDEYHEAARWAHDKVIEYGLGIAVDPVRRASAATVRVSKGSLADGTYYVAVAWMNAAGEEGASSAPVTIAVSGSSFAVETDLPARAKGWNVYSGTSPETMTLQNGTALAAGQSWVQPNSLSTTGRAAGDGQKATYILAVPRAIQRG